MALWRPDPTFYPSPRMAMQAPPEKLAFVAMLNPRNDGRPDALAVVDVEASSPSCGQIVGQGICLELAMRCTTLAGTLAARACARMRRIPT